MITINIITYVSFPKLLSNKLQNKVPCFTTFKNLQARKMIIEDFLDLTNIAFLA